MASKPKPYLYYILGATDEPSQNTVTGRYHLDMQVRRGLGTLFVHSARDLSMQQVLRLRLPTLVTMLIV